MNVVIADSHTVVRLGLKQMLAVEPDIKVVGEARTPDETVKVVRDVEWDVMILGYAIPGGAGLSVLKAVKDAFPLKPVLLLSVFPESENMPADDAIAISALRAGAAGYLDNDDCTAEELAMALRHVMSGRKFVSAALAERLVTGLGEGSPVAPHESLSEREHRVMSMIANGKSISQIAAELMLRPNTVSTYRNRILKKLALTNNAGLVRYAIKYGLME